jgi:MFS family permease
MGKDPGGRHPFVRVRLSAMMFLQYAIWGAWLPLLWPFLSGHRGFTPGQIGDMFAVGAAGAIVAPFVAGQIADRHFATQWFLGLSHIAGGLLVWQLSRLEGYWEFLGFSLAYSLIYAPTLSLTNSLSFHHLADRDRDFGKVRLWGTIGWIAVGIGIGQWLLATWTPDAREPAPGVSVEQIHERPRGGTAAALAANPGQLEGVLSVALVGEANALAARKMLEERRRAVPMVTLAGGRPIVDYAAALPALREAGVSDEALGQRQVEELAALIVQGSQQKGMADAFRVSAILGVLMGFYCLTLPHTPPIRSGRRNAWLEALGEIRHQPLITLFLLAVPISCIHQFYFVHTAGFLGSYQSRTAAAINSVFGVGGGGLMTVGQMAEILVLAAIPLLSGRVSRKALLGIGIVAYALRMALFAYVDSIAAATGVPAVGVLITGVALHGLCFGCFIFVAFMVVDEESTPDVRASAQSLFNLVIVGVGIIVGSKVAGYVAQWASSSGAMDYRRLFSVPMWGALACLVVLLAAYPRRGRRAPRAQEQVA